MHVQSTHVTTTYEGPLPPPAILEEYDRIVPGAAARIMEWAEKQTAHRQHLERAIIDHDIAHAQRGLTFGFVVVCLCLLFAGGFVFTGHDQAGIATLVTTLVSVAGTFVYGTQHRTRELRRKERLQSGATIDTEPE